MLEHGLTPKLNDSFATTDLEERAAYSKLIAVETTGENDLLSRFSNISNLIEVTAFVLRFFENSKIRKNLTSIAKASIPMPTISETSNALRRLLLILQKTLFLEEINQLS